MNLPGASVIELRAVSHLAPAAAPLEISLSIEPRSFTLLCGPARREIWRIAALVDAPATGEVLIEGVPASGWSEEQRAEWRALRLATLRSAPFLLPALTVIENVAMPIFKRHPETTPEEGGRQAQALLEFVGLGGETQRPAGELGVAEQGAVAVARALAGAPAALFVDEAEAASLRAGRSAMAALLRRVAESHGVPVVVCAGPDFPRATGDRVITCDGLATRTEAALITEKQER